MIIERATGMKVGRLIIRAQRVVNGVDTDYHGMRMDVTVEELEEEEDTVIQFFDIEPNNVQKVHLPKRSRFYQALADVKLLETGVDYDKLPNIWTIWILPYDPFGKNQMVYTVKNRVEEFPEVEYNDGVVKLFLYTEGKGGGTDSLKALLGYMRSSRAENAVDQELKELHANVERLKSNAKIGVKYMQMLHLSCPQPIYRWFKGSILPSVDHLFYLSRILHCHMEDLLVVQGAGQRGKEWAGRKRMLAYWQYFRKRLDNKLDGL